MNYAFIYVLYTGDKNKQKDRINKLQFLSKITSISPKIKTILVPQINTSHQGEMKNVA